MMVTHRCCSAHPRDPADEHPGALTDLSRRRMGLLAATADAARIAPWQMGPGEAARHCRGRDNPVPAME